MYNKKKKEETYIMKNNQSQKNLDHTLCVFKNDKLKIYHIWTSQQFYNPIKKTVNNVTIQNAFSKSIDAYSGKDSSQSAATTSFYRVISTTKKKDWNQENINLGFVNKSELNTYKNMQKEELEKNDYKCISSRDNCRFHSGKYAGREWVKRNPCTLSEVRRIKHCKNMLEDAQYKKDDLLNIARKIAKNIIRYNQPLSYISNFSQLWSHIRDTYYSDSEYV